MLVAVCLMNTVKPATITNCIVRVSRIFAIFLPCDCMQLYYLPLIPWHLNSLHVIRQTRVYICDVLLLPFCDAILLRIYHCMVTINKSVVLTAGYRYRSILLGSYKVSDTPRYNGCSDTSGGSRHFTYNDTSLSAPQQLVPITTLVKTTSQKWGYVTRQGTHTLIPANAIRIPVRLQLIKCIYSYRFFFSHH
jgi:hypothetical protein